MSKKKKVEYRWEKGKLREVDRSLSMLLQVVYELNLIPEEARNNAATCDTNLLVPIEDV